MDGEKQSSPSGARNAILAGFLGWTLDAFDFFILTFVLAPIAKEFGQAIPAIALTITASLATRWIGAILFGLFADRYGRRIPLIVNILYFSLIEVLSGLAPNYRVFFFLRLLYGVGMGGEWGVGASLTIVRARKSERTRSLAPLAHGLDDLPTRHIPQLEALRLSRSVTGYDEFHFSRHSGYVPDSLTATTWLQSAAHVGLHRDFDDRGALRRVGVRVHI